jgi:lipopolysaccharide transport system ATP-binding protein
MTAPVIEASGLSKKYRLGPRAAYGALRDTIAQAASAPFRALAALGRPAVAAADDPTILWALKDVSFTIGQGEIVGVIGRNGSGKSTLLKILSRITEPTSGSVRIRGTVGALLEVGTGFHPELSGRENVFVNGAILGMKRREIARKFDEIVAFADVDRFIDTPVKHYSSGMQMRLAFAVAAHLEPTILLVDEVLAVGDMAFQQKCIGKMDEVSRDGRTILFVSHQMNQLRRLCGRSVWLDGGQVVATGPTADIINRYEASLMQSETDAGGRAQSPGARFLGWTLGASGASEHAFNGHGELVVRFLLRVDRPIAGGHHGIALYDRDGRIMWSTDTDDLDLTPGVHEIVYSLSSLPLRPGSYRWHVSIFDRDKFIDNLDCVPLLSVETAPLGHPLDAYQGVLNLPYSIDVTPLAAAEPALVAHAGSKAS